MIDSKEKGRRQPTSNEILTETVRSKNSRTFHPSKLTKLFYPRTNADFHRICEFVARGLTDLEVVEILKGDIWRTELIEFQGELFCGSCDSVISLNWCPDCGEPQYKRGA